MIVKREANGSAPKPAVLVEGERLTSVGETPSEPSPQLQGLADNSTSAGSGGSTSGDGETVRLQGTVLLTEEKEEVTITARVEGDARLVVKEVRVAVDTDNDGLVDNRETEASLPTHSGSVETDPEAWDSDGDGLVDGKELTSVVQTSTGEVFRVRSRPDRVDTDDDGLSDATEVTGWAVRVERRNGQPYKWTTGGPEKGGKETMKVRSDPVFADTDGDGVSDAVEKRELHTDPEARQTYRITRAHERYLDRLYQEWIDRGRPTAFAESMFVIGLIDSPSEMHTLDNIDLTDKTDDFDFLLQNHGSTPIHRMQYQTVDGETRTDVWLPNHQEMNPSARSSPFDSGLGATDPWKADSDSDGLTDGQELGIVTVVQSEQSIINDRDLSSYEISPNKADSDGDGAPDGGGYVEVAGFKLGKQQERRGELWEIESNPEKADVVHILAAHDEEWREKYDRPVNRVQNIIERTQYFINSELEDGGYSDVYFEYENIKYKSNDSLYAQSLDSARPKRHMWTGAKRIGWPSDGYDVLSMFSHQPMSRSPHSKISYTRFISNMLDKEVSIPVNVGINGC